MIFATMHRRAIAKTVCTVLCTTRLVQAAGNLAKIFDRYDINPSRSGKAVNGKARGPRTPPTSYRLSMQNSGRQRTRPRSQSTNSILFKPTHFGSHRCYVEAKNLAKSWSAKPQDFSEVYGNSQERTEKCKTFQDAISQVEEYLKIPFQFARKAHKKRVQKYRSDLKILKEWLAKLSKPTVPIVTHEEANMIVPEKHISQANPPAAPKPIKKILSRPANRRQVDSVEPNVPRPFNPLGTDGSNFVEEVNHVNCHQQPGKSNSHRIPDESPRSEVPDLEDPEKPDSELTDDDKTCDDDDTATNHTEVSEVTEITEGLAPQDGQEKTDWISLANELCEKNEIENITIGGYIPERILLEACMISLTNSQENAEKAKYHQTILDKDFFKFLERWMQLLFPKSERTTFLNKVKTSEERDRLTPKRAKEMKECIRNSYNIIRVLKLLDSDIQERNQVCTCDLESNQGAGIQEKLLREMKFLFYVTRVPIMSFQAAIRLSLPDTGKRNQDIEEMARKIPAYNKLGELLKKVDAAAAASGTGTRSLQEWNDKYIDLVNKLKAEEAKTNN